MPLVDTVVEDESPIVDAFTYSTSLLYLPTSYRTLQYAQMEVLRRAKGYTARWYTAPTAQSIPAASQKDYQVQTIPGSYLWGCYFAVPAATSATQLALLFVQITEHDTGVKMFSDYTRAGNLNRGVAAIPGNRLTSRNPYLFTQPRLLSGSGVLDVEIYNSTANAYITQLLMLCAEPNHPLEGCATPPPLTTPIGGHGGMGPGSNNIGRGSSPGAHGINGIRNGVRR